MKRGALGAETAGCREGVETGVSNVGDILNLIWGLATILWGWKVGPDGVMESRSVKEKEFV